MKHKRRLVANRRGTLASNIKAPPGKRCLQLCLRWQRQYPAPFAFLLGAIVLLMQSHLRFLRQESDVFLWQLQDSLGNDGAGAGGAGPSYVKDGTVGHDHNGDDDDDVPSFSACLLSLDENPRLPEWIAYHWHVMPLRYLIVASDPRSKTSPKPILDLFQRELGLQYELWTDEAFNIDGSLDPVDFNRTGMGRLRDMHRSRQKLFYKVCMDHLRQTNKTWTSLHDVDEYITFQKFNQTQEIEVLETNRDGKRSENAASIVTSPSSMKNQGGVSRFIQRLNINENMKHCHSFPRLLYGSTKETTAMEALAQSAGMESSRLDTLRWNHHGPRRSSLNGKGKVMVDVSYLPPLEKLVVYNVHRPVMELCSTADYSVTKYSPFVANHYLGSWEMYSYRDDARKGRDRTHQAWRIRSEKMMSEMEDVNSHWQLASWLEGFVAQYGKRKVHTLLKDAGLPKTLNLEKLHEEWKPFDGWEQ